MVNYRSEQKDSTKVATTLKPKIKPLTAEKAVKMVNQAKNKK